MTGLFADINSIKVVDKYEQTTILELSATLKKSLLCLLKSIIDNLHFCAKSSFSLQ